jgi:hypothetical protein
MNVELLAGAAGALLAVCASIAALTALHEVRRWRDRCASLESSIEALRREFERVASISVRTGRRVQRVEHHFSGVAERVDAVESRAALGSESLDQAIDFARRGADRDHLQQRFGLSVGEADLVARLHGRKPRRSA